MELSQKGRVNPSGSIIIDFPLQNTRARCDGTRTLAEICADAQLPLELACGGKGFCGKCDVVILEDGIEKKVRACRYTPDHPIQVLLTPPGEMDRILASSGPEALPFDPLTRVFCAPRSALTEDPCAYDLATIRRAIDRPMADIPDPLLLEKCTEVLHDGDSPDISFVLRGDVILDILPCNGPAPVYGVAFDIGTTTVVGYLFDLTCGTQLASASAQNGQVVCGADVITRIEYAGRSRQARRHIQDLLMETLNAIISQLTEKAHVAPEAIYACVCCGNSTMSHLFWGLSPASLGTAPFTGIKQEMITAAAHTTSLTINPSARVTFLPLLGGFVGADTTAVLLSLPLDGRNRLVIDLGTNGEIAVGNGSRYLVASTACGPALEGSGITQGMRACAGAIEKITETDGRLHCLTIGGAAPKGFCGSGIIDAAAFLLARGLIRPDGRFVDAQDPAARPYAARMKALDTGERLFEFVTAEENPKGVPLYITQKDIRAIQLAKAAVYTGCLILLENYGIPGTKLEEIAIAGAFGNYINMDHAQALGLIPSFEGVPVRFIGNAAGGGVQRCLLDRREVKRCAGIPSFTSHVELATDPEFPARYLRNTGFDQKVITAEDSHEH
jgi:uncharacterized 2Fe-2S/4Fe-4S cluster protein (DUF4445 family)